LHKQSLTLFSYAVSVSLLCLSYSLLNIMIKRTALYGTAQGLNAQFTEQAGWQVPNLYSSVKDELQAATRKVGVADMSQVDKIRVEGATAEALLQAALNMPALNIGQVAELSETVAVSRLRRDLFFLMVMAGQGSLVIDQLYETAETQEGLVTISNSTQGSSVIALFGPYGDELMSKLCGLDFHATAFPNLTVKQSSVAKTRQTIIRHDINGVKTYLLVGGRSLSAYLWSVIMEAGAEYGVEPVGSAAIQALATA